MVRVPRWDVANSDGCFVVSESVDGAVFDDVLSEGVVLTGPIAAVSVSLADVCRWAGGVAVLTFVNVRPVVVSTTWLAPAGGVARCATVPECSGGGTVSATAWRGRISVAAGAGTVKDVVPLVPVAAVGVARFVVCLKASFPWKSAVVGRSAGPLEATVATVETAGVTAGAAPRITSGSVDGSEAFRVVTSTGLEVARRNDEPAGRTPGVADASTNLPNVGGEPVVVAAVMPTVCWTRDSVAVVANAAPFCSALLSRSP